MSEDEAREVFKQAAYPATEEDIQRLSKNMELLEERGLGKLNQKIRSDVRNIWDFIAEHNFAAQLTLSHSSNFSIIYEPPEKQSPPDFKIEKENITYWIQMKRPSDHEMGNRHNNIIREILRSSKSIKVQKSFSCYLSLEFIKHSTKNDVIELNKFIKNMAEHSTENYKYFFPNDENKKAVIVFRPQENPNFFHLTLESDGYMDSIEVTGVYERQIKDSLRNASCRFNWEANENVINLVVMEADNYHNKTIFDAVFGFRERNPFLSGNSEGFFQDEKYSRQVSGIIAIRRKERYKPICSYDMALYINALFNSHRENIDRLFSFIDIFHL